MRLYPVEVVEVEADSVKLHYVRYSSDLDEWRDSEDIVEPKHEMYTPYEPHKQLTFQIKLALDSGNRRYPETRVELPFDRVLFAGGLQQCGTIVSTTRGHAVYTIHTYGDLVPFLGENWYIRGLNDRLDFCYVNLKTVCFYLYERKPIPDYTLSGKQLIRGGNILVFRFVRMDGVRSKWDEICKLA